jgi:hypothetical protein
MAVTDEKQTQETDPGGMGTYLIAGVGHALGVGLTAAGLLLLAVPFETVLPYIGFITADAQLVDRTLFEAGVHLGLAAAIWTLMVLIYRQFTKTREVKVVRLTSAGAVLAETIIVLPVMLLIIFGLAQVATNNIAGMLANVAAFQGARTAWVWQGEIGTNRGDTAIDAGDVKERARIASALVMTPVAPGGYRQINTGQSQEFKNVREAIFAGQFMIGGSLAGSASSAYSALGAAQSQEMRMSKALDEASFIRRTYMKFSHAYDSVNVSDINVDTSSNEITFTLEYLHQQAFPVVGVIFGERLYTHNAPSNRPGRYLRIKRNVTLPMRVCDTDFSSPSQSKCPANDTWPH